MPHYHTCYILVALFIYYCFLRVLIAPLSQKNTSLFLFHSTVLRQSEAEILGTGLPGESTVIQPFCNIG